MESYYKYLQEQRDTDPEFCYKESAGHMARLAWYGKRYPDFLTGKMTRAIEDWETGSGPFSHDVRGDIGVQRPLLQLISGWEDARANDQIKQLQREKDAWRQKEEDRRRAENARFKRFEY